MKKAIRVILIVSLVLVLGVGGLLAFLTITDYKPDSIESIQLVDNSDVLLDDEKVLSLYTWNIGYGSLGEEEDFFLDDGKKSKSNSRSVVEAYMDGIGNVITSFDADFIMLQEIDVEAARSYRVNQKQYLDDLLDGYSSSFATNYDVEFVPLPMPPTGEIEAGIGTYSKYHIEEVTRYALPGQYSWPKSVVMLDRCMMVSRLPIQDSERQLVIANAHFSAYDDGSIRAQQLAFIKDFVLEEYRSGNYVVLGGDWNQTFPGVDIESYPVYKEGEYWLPYQIEEDWIDEGWTFAYGNGEATYRLLNAPYEEGVSQTGVIDGFLVSPNVQLVDTKVIDLSFEYSDHNPVEINIKLIN